MSFSELIAGTAKILQLDAGASGEMRNFQMSFADGLVLTVELLPGDQMISISGLLCHFPDPATLVALTPLLTEAHAYGLATDGGAFAFDRSESKVVMFRNYELDDLDAEKLAARIRRFAGALALWRESYASGRLLAAARSETESPAAPPSGSFA
jgi:Tir chaperone protein (CesT) family